MFGDVEQAINNGYPVTASIYWKPNSNLQEKTGLFDEHTYLIIDKALIDYQG